MKGRKLTPPITKEKKEKKDMQDKAQVSMVKFGDLEIEGLRWVDEDGKVNYGVAVSQLAAKSVVPHKNASRGIKTLLGEGFQFLKKSSELNPKPVNVIKASDFSKAIATAAFNGNPVAQEMALILVGASVETLFADAFGDTQTPQDRQEVLKVLAQQWATPNQMRYRNEQKAMRGKGHFFNQDFRLDAVVIFAGEEYLGMKRLKESYPALLFRLGKYEESGILQTVLNHLAHFGEPYDEDFWPKFFQAYPELTKFRKDL